MRTAVPLIGQSSSVTPARCKRFLARSLSASGSVLVSITISRGLLAARLAEAILSTASSSAATVASDVIRTSAFAATAVLEASARPPAFISRRRGGAATS